MRRMGFGSAGEMIFLFVLALIVLGPKRLPELARQLGKFMNEFKRASNEFKYQIESEISNMELQERRAKQQILPPVAPQASTPQTASPMDTTPPEELAPAPPPGTIASGSLTEGDTALANSGAHDDGISSEANSITAPAKGSNA